MEKVVAIYVQRAGRIAVGALAACEIFFALKSAQ